MYQLPGRNYNKSMGLLMSLFYEYKRRRRIKNPEKYDHCSYLLIGIMGAEWWIEHGFVREYPVGRYNIDFAHPKFKVAIEGDGRNYHTDPMDVLHDETRDKALRHQGWYVQRFRYEELKNKPAKVRALILETYESFAPPTAKQIKATKRVMRRSGMKV